MKGLSVSSLASAGGAAGVAMAAGAWSRTLSIQVRMNSWKRSFGAGAGAGPGAGASGPRAGRLMAGFLRRAGGILESGERKVTSLPCLPNRLAEPLWELFRIVVAG